MRFGGDWRGGLVTRGSSIPLRCIEATLASLRRGFARLMDNVIGGLFASGEIRAIHAKWFESGAFRLPMSQYMKENIKLPNKYGVP